MTENYDFNNIENEKRFVDDGFEAIDEQSFTDTETDKTYYVDYFDEIIELCNELHEENIQYKQELDNVYLLIGRGDWGGLVDLIKGDLNDRE